MFKLCLLLVAALVLVGPQAVKGLMGADNAKPREFPYHAFLRIHATSFCSGALISPKHILSAGHCVEVVKDLAESVNALLGTVSLTSGGTAYPIVDKVHHPLFKRRVPADWMYDIGIFTLKRSAILSKLVNIVKRPDKNIEPGSYAVVSGAGYITAEGPPSKVLQKLKIKIIDRTRCQSMMPDTIQIKDMHICTFDESGKGVNAGDSGGPLVHNDFVFGISSGYLNATTKSYPDVFTNVYECLTWINKVVDK